MDQDEQLYVLDVYLNKLTFAPCMMDVPRKEAIDVSVSFRNLVNMNIRTENSIAAPCMENTGLPRDILNLNFGKSQVFFSKAENLLMALNESPLKLILTMQWNPKRFGEASLAWTLDFLSMVDRSKHFPNHLTPAGIERIQDIISNDSGQVVGRIDMFIRLSCFGRMTFEEFQEMPRLRPIALQPPHQSKTLLQALQPPDSIQVITFLIGLISFTAFITALYLAIK